MADRLTSRTSQYWKMLTSIPWFFFFFRIGLIFCALLILGVFLVSLNRLAATDYSQFSIFFSYLRINYIQLGIAVAVLSALSIFTALGTSWSKIEYGRELRLLIVTLAALLAWSLATYGYNHFFDRYHAIDRIILLLFACLIWLRPVFAFAFVVLALPMLLQIGTPISASSIFAHKTFIIECLLIFAAWQLARSFSVNFKASDFIFILCCLVAGRYWYAGLAKLSTDWVTYGHLERMVMGAYGHGWLSFLSPDNIVNISNLVSPFESLMRWFVLIIEVSALFFLAHRRLAIGLLIAYMLFHLAVFAMIGFLFWTWIAVDLALLLVLLSGRVNRQSTVFLPRHFVLSVPLIAFAGIWGNPSYLAWFDTNLSYSYRLDVVGESGTVYNLPANSLQPYEDVFTFGAFGFLVKDRPVLTGPYGTTHSLKVAQSIDDARSADEVLALEKSGLVEVRYNAARAGAFYDFLTRYLTNRNVNGPKLGWLEKIGAPNAMWSFGWKNLYNDQERIQKVVVTETTNWFDGKNLSTIREVEIKSLDIPSGFNDTDGVTN